MLAPNELMKFQSVYLPQKTSLTKHGNRIKTLIHRSVIVGVIVRAIIERLSARELILCNGTRIAAEQK